MILVFDLKFEILKFEICNAVIPLVLSRSAALPDIGVRAVFGLKRGRKGVDICLA